MTPEQIARLAALRALTSLSDEETAELDTLVALETEQGGQQEQAGEPVTAPSGASDAAAADAGTEGVRPPGGPDPAADESGAAEGDASSSDADADAAADQAAADAAAAAAGTDTPAGSTEQAPSGAPTDEVAALRAENARLRQDAANAALATLRSSGIVTQQNETDASFLLSHDDEEVRRRAGAVLGSLRAPVELGATRGATRLAAGANGGAETSTGELIRLGMEPEEVGDLWASLSTEERKLRQPEYDRWRHDRAAQQ